MEEHQERDEVQQPKLERSTASVETFKRKPNVGLCPLNTSFILIITSSKEELFFCVVISSKGKLVLLNRIVFFKKVTSLSQLRQADLSLFMCFVFFFF